jgi:hypothetical protein
MRKLFAIFALLALGACSTFASTTVSTVKVQQGIDFAVAAYKADLRAEIMYLRQPPCGLANSPKPPLCASYAVGIKWKALDAKLKGAITDAQTKLDAVGTDPKVIDAAMAAIQLVLIEIENFSTEIK